VKLATLALVIANLASMPIKHARGYAVLIDAAATRSRVPPLLLVAIVDGESHWNPRIMNARSGAAGLGQVLTGACARSPTSEACRVSQAPLFDPETNLRRSAAILRGNWRLCGRTWEGALAGYQTGRCRPVPLTRTVAARWKALERAAATPGRLRTPPRTPDGRQAPAKRKRVLGRP